MDKIVDCFQREPILCVKVIAIPCGCKRGVGVKLRVVHEAGHVLTNHALRFAWTSVFAMRHPMTSSGAREVLGDCVDRFAKGL
jgi:hypothetical protein